MGNKLASFRQTSLNSPTKDQSSFALNEQMKVQNGAEEHEKKNKFYVWPQSFPFFYLSVLYYYYFC